MSITSVKDNVSNNKRESVIQSELQWNKALEKCNYNNCRQ